MLAAADGKDEAKWSAKIWGCSLGTLEYRDDPQHLPAGLTRPWPGAGYAKIDPAKIQFSGVSSDGGQAVFGARGEIFSASVDGGEVGNLTRTTSVSERDPAWSPDGKSIAYFSDESGEYALHVYALTIFPPPPVPLAQA